MNYEEKAQDLRQVVDEKDKQIAALKRHMTAQQEMITRLSQRNMELEETLWSQLEALTKATNLICDLMRDKRTGSEGKQGG